MSGAVARGGAAGARLRFVTPGTGRVSNKSTFVTPAVALTTIETVPVAPASTAVEPKETSRRSRTKTVKVEPADRLGLPLSVTRTGIWLVLDAWARFGVQANTAVTGLTRAP